MSPELEQKISAARTRLILDQPFLGVLVLRLPLVAAQSTWCPTTATDMVTLYYNPEYLDALGIRQIEFVLAHEALHCALAHFTRRGQRAKHRWDVACDFAINPILLEEGLRPPANVITFLEYAGMTAEEIYPLIEENTDQEPMDRHLDGSQNAALPQGPDSNINTEVKSRDSPAAAAEPLPLSQGERERAAKQWQMNLAVAAQRAALAGKLGSRLAALVESFLQPTLPWRALLARYMMASARNDYSYARPSRREGTAILPRLHSRHIDVAVVLDNSGSISNEELQEFIVEIDALKAQLGARITLLACDTELAPGAPWTFEAWESMQFPRQLPRGGGTSLVPPFDWVAHCVMPPDLLIYFTDARGEFPALEPTYPVLWLIKGGEQVPWGVRVQLN